jgi:hypothetical protein
MARTIQITSNERHGRAQRVAAPDDPAIHAPLGLAKEDVDARARRCDSRCPDMTIGIVEVS